MSNMNTINGIYSFNIKQISVLGFTTTICTCTLSVCSAAVHLLSSELPNEILELKIPYLLPVSIYIISIPT